MPPYIDLTGQRFGRIVVVKRSGTHRKGGALFLCQCDCGNVSEVRAQSLRQGHTKSCGCYNADQKRQICIERTTHGQTGTRAYHAWVNMIQRCTNPKVAHYPRYGGRGIKVCERWLAFESFLADMGECPGTLTLERENTNGNYEPGNCKWATMKEQQNNRTNNHLLTLDGQTFTVVEWARRTGIQRETIAHRIWLGWSVERALTEKPIRGRNQHTTKPNLTLTRRAREAGLRPSTVHDRLRRGWPIERALTEPVK